MARTIAKRPRGELTAPVGMNYVVNRPFKERLEAIAANSGVSASVMFEKIIEHVELTDQGVPIWWTPLSRNEELPINPD